MRNQDLPDIDPAQHERLCAYVFGELQGPERAAFEAELLRSPALRRAQAELENTVGLVKRAVPDEGLSPDVRRELLASARRKTFRFVPGRRMLQLVAAAVVLAGAVLLVRQRAIPAERSPEVRDGTRVARVEAPAKLVERELEDAPASRAGAARPAPPAAEAAQAGPAASEESAPAATPLLVQDFGVVAPAEEPWFDALGIDSAAQPRLGKLPQADQEDIFGVPVLRLEATQAAQAPGEASSVSLLAFSGQKPESGAASFSLGHGQPQGGSGGTPGAEFLRAKVYRGPGDSVPPSSAEPVVQERLRDLGYVGAASNEASQGARAEARELLDALGYGGGEEPHADDLDGAARLATRVRPTPQADQRRTQAESGAALARERVAAEVEQILGTCRVGAGESPGAMFFRYFGDSPFLSTREQNLSTFAADVDTASYALARAYLNRGELPPREAVRTEEFVNYFKADQPPPTDGSPFAIGLELAPSLFGGGQAELLRVTVRARDVADFQRQPLALTLVLDNSGSMQDGGRLELVKRALALLLRQLDNSDTIAIVKFSNTASVVTPAIQASRRGELEALIAGLPIEGGTNVEGGLRLGYEQALASLRPRTVHRVVLCSDGVGNIGETRAKELLALVAEAREQGVYLNTVGVGMGNHDDAFLEELANKGDGVCSYVDSDAEAKRVFVDGLASLVQPVARDVKIQVELDPAQVESWRLLGYENRALRAQDFRNDAIDAGEVNAGHQVSALYELVRRPGLAGTLATVRLRYKPPFAIDAGREGRAAAAEVEQALEVERTLSGSAVLPGFAAATSGYQRAVLVAQLAEVLRQSVHARGDSFATLLSESRRLERVLGDPDFTEFVALLEKANPLLDALAKQETPKTQELLDRLARLRFEQARRGRERELAREAGEPAPSEDARREVERLEAETLAEITRLEGELRAELYRARGIEPPPETLELLQAIGYGDEEEH